MCGGHITPERVIKHVSLIKRVRLRSYAIKTFQSISRYICTTERFPLKIQGLSCQPCMSVYAKDVVVFIAT